VHHSIEKMEWVAAGRLHPFDQALHAGFPWCRLVILGTAADLSRCGVFVDLCAGEIFQHANVRLRIFPG